MTTNPNININLNSTINTNIKILCIIPARSGSKGIKDKNIKSFKGKPLLAWSICQAQQSQYSHQMKIIVSTDSQEYAEIARQYGAEIPFLRPDNISHDTSTDYEYIEHAVSFLRREGYNPDIILQLRPTSPLRKSETIDECLSIFIKNRQKYDSLRTVVSFDKSPFKMYTIENEELKPLFLNVNEIQEPYNQCRQVLPTCYLHNGYIDIFNTTLLDTHTISGKTIYPYVMDKEDEIDIDTMDDWNKATKSETTNTNGEK